MNESNTTRLRSGWLLVMTMGAASGALGYVFGLGVGSSVSEILIGLIAGVLAITVLSQFIDLSGRLIKGAFPGLLLGLLFEAWTNNIQFSILGGASGVLALHWADPQTRMGRKENRDGSAA